MVDNHGTGYRAAGLTRKTKKRVGRRRRKPKSLPEGAVELYVDFTADGEIHTLDSLTRKAVLFGFARA